MTLLDDTHVTPVQAALDDPTDMRLGEVARTAGESSASQIDDLLDHKVEAEADLEPQINPFLASAAAMLATAAVGWMLGGVFAGSFARLVGVAGAVIGAGTVGLSYRLRSPTVVQCLALPLSVLAGVALVARDTFGGVNLVTLVSQAIQAGGLSQPPVPFDPGWRFLLVVLTSAIAVTASTAAVSFNRSHLSVLLPAPVIIAGVLLQSPSREVSSVSGALLLAVAGLAVAFGGELARESETGAHFEIRRLLKAGGMLAVIIAILIGLSQFSFLYPAQQSSTVIPPKRPQTPPFVSNHLLFAAIMSQPEPLRTGVLDVYDGTAWLTPPYDPARFVPVSQRNLPSFASSRAKSGQLPSEAAPTHLITVRITIADLGEQRQVPDVADPVAIEHAPHGLQYDPRSQTLQTPGRPRHGMSYTVVAAAPPSASVLSAAGKPGEDLAPYLQVPAPPPAVADLLTGIPPGLSPYLRLQYVRTVYFRKAVAAGPGNPVNVPPLRVQQILQGHPASPYEITAGEVLLARWAGIPARIGYGYYDDLPSRSGRYDIYPSDGRMWLEAYFSGSGWVPILGHPARALSSLDQHPKHRNNQIRPNGEILAQLYIPLRQPSLQLLYTILEFWLVHAVLPVGGLIFLVWFLIPGLLKTVRRLHRSRWALQRGVRSRVAVAYAELRDRAIDFNLGHPSLTPLEFLDVLVPDEEHLQLAWLVSRALWGDLSRDLRDEDAEVAEQMAHSLARRLTTAQPAVLRAAAFASRISLRDPYSREIPNLWWSPQPRRWLPGVGHRVRSLLARRPLRPRAAVSAMLVLACSLFLSGCVQQPNLGLGTRQLKPLPNVPREVDGDTLAPAAYPIAAFSRYQPEALISTLRLYTVRSQGIAVGTLQVAEFKPGLRSRNLTVREGVVNSLGGAPTVETVGGQRLYVVTVNALRLFVHFAADGQIYELLAADNQFVEPDRFFAGMLTVEQGGTVTSVRQGAPPVDARRGLS